MIQRHSMLCASQRVTYLDSTRRHEDSYAVSQQFCEWTNSFDVYPQVTKAATLKVPTFNKENRTA